MKLLDLFSGFGGVSVAAQASGLQIVEGVDADAHAAAAFAQNFPLARAKHAELGPGLPYEWPAPAPDLWVHASPPCTALSRANRSGAGRDGGLALTAWTVRQLVEREYAYFSVEQVLDFGVASRTCSTPQSPSRIGSGIEGNTFRKTYSCVSSRAFTPLTSSITAS